jgi:hypothetical protein
MRVEEPGPLCYNAGGVAAGGREHRQVGMTLQHMLAAEEGN